MKRYWIAACGLLILSGAAEAQGATATATLSVTTFTPLAAMFTPPNPSVACNAAPGTSVSVISSTGGDGQPVTFSLSGSASFILSGAQVVVAAGGIAAADCGKVVTMTGTATQP